MTTDHMSIIGPPEPLRHLMGLRYGQIMVMALACVIAVGLSLLLHGALGAIGAVLVIAMGLMAAWIPWNGRHCDEWLSVIAWHGHARLMAKRALVVRVDDAGLVWATSTVTKYIGLEVEPLALQSYEERSQRTQAFAYAIAATLSTHSSLSDISWTISTQVRDPRANSARWVRCHRQGSAQSLLDCYRETLHEGHVETMAQHIVMALSAPPLDGEGLEAAVKTLEAELNGTGIRLHNLDAADSGAWLSSLTGASVRGGDVGLSVDPRWGAAKSGGTTFVAYWVEQFPSSGIGPELFADLFVRHGGVSLQVTMRHMDAATALRRVRSRRTSSIADATMRRRAGFLASTKAQHLEDERQRRESRYASGEAGMVLSVIIMMREDEERNTEMVASLQAKGVGLRRLNGEHAQRLAAFMDPGMNQ